MCDWFPFTTRSCYDLHYKRTNYISRHKNHMVRLSWRSRLRLNLSRQREQLLWSYHKEKGIYIGVNGQPRVPSTLVSDLQPLRYLTSRHEDGLQYWSCTHKIKDIFSHAHSNLRPNICCNKLWPAGSLFLLPNDSKCQLLTKRLVYLRPFLPLKCI